MIIIGLPRDPWGEFVLERYWVFTISLMSYTGSGFLWDAESLKPGHGHRGMSVGMEQIDEFRGQ